MLFRRRKRPTLWTVKHPTHGKMWGGPYKWDGVGYTAHTELAYKFRTADGAAVTLRGCDMHDHEITQL